jgi:trans-2,3-dihydro-3-hydroxyanthranilate isomerase
VSAVGGSAGADTELTVARVDVFTSRPFAGNPAAAVLDADGLSESAMQAIAREMRAAGTAFVSASGAPGAHFALRKFTPTREVLYSGHTTLGAVRALLDAGRLTGPRAVFDTALGPLPVAIEAGPDGVVLWLEPALPVCVPFDGPLRDIITAAGLPARGLGTWARPAVTPDTNLLVPVADLATLRGLAPDLGRLGQVGGGLGLRACCFVSLEAVEPTSAVHSRFFAPQFGIPEDIVTGSVHSGLAVWLHEAGRLAVADGIAAFTAEQGDGLGRPGRLSIALRTDAGRPVAVRVGGRAVAVMTGRMRRPD